MICSYNTILKSNLHIVMNTGKVMIYCVIDKKKLPCTVHVERMRNGRYRFAGTCPNGHKVSQFVTRAEAQGSGLLGNLLGLPNGRVPVLSDLPLIGGLF